MTEAKPNGRSARGRIALRALFVLYAVALTLGTHWPALVLPAAGAITRMDLILHVGAFGAGTALLIACGWFGPALTTRNIRLSAAMGFIWATVDEASQGLPGLNRQVGLDDWAMNMAGVGAAALGALWVARRRRARHGADDDIP